MRSYKFNNDGVTREDGAFLELVDPEVLDFLAKGGVIAPQFTPEEQVEITRQEAMAKIVDLEGRQHRAIREAVLSGDLSRVKSLDAEIAELRKAL